MLHYAIFYLMSGLDAALIE